MMEENTCLKTHLAKMHGIHLSLMEDFDYWTTDESAINTVLHSFPPSFRDYIHGVERKVNPLSFSLDDVGIYTDERTPHKVSLHEG